MPAPIATSIEGHRAPDAASGLPTGGATGQLLQKNSSANYDTAWADPPESGGGGGTGGSAGPIANPVFPLPPADGRNLFCYRFDEGALLADSGDAPGGPYPLSDAAQGNIVQENSSVAPVFGRQITGGGNAGADRLQTGSGSLWDGSDVADGFTFYLNFRTPAIGGYSLGDAVALFHRVRSDGGLYGTKGLFGAWIEVNDDEDSTRWTLRVYVSDSAGTNFTWYPKYGLESGAGYRLRVTVGADGTGVKMYLNETLFRDTTAGGDVRAGWAATDDFHVLGTGTFGYGAIGRTQKASAGTAVDQVLMRLGTDPVPFVFDADWTGEGVSAPPSAGSAGTPGQLAYDGGYLYVCVAADTWKRAALSSW